MVTVPTNPVPSVTVNAPRPVFRDPAVPSGAFDLGGEGLEQAGQLLANASDQLDTFAFELQDEFNTTEIRDADNAMAGGIREVVFGDAEAGVEGFYGKKQKNALDGYPDAEDAIAKAVTTAIDGASNEVVRREVERLGRARQQAALDRMGSHLQAEQRAYADATGEAREAQAALDAADDWRSNEVLLRSLGIVEQEVLAWAERNGASPEVAAVRLRERQTAVVKGAFDNAIASGAVGVASGILLRNRDVLTPTTRAKMQDTVRSEGRAAVAQGIAQEAYTRFPSDPAGARQWIRDTYSGKEESAALSVYQQRIEAERSDFRFGLLVEGAKRDEKAQEIAQLAQDAVPGDPVGQRKFIRENFSGKDETAAIGVLESDASALRAQESDTRARYNHEVQRESYERSQQERQDDLFAREYIWGNTGDQSPTVDEFRSLYPEIWDRMTAAQRTSFETKARNVAEGNLYAQVSDGQTLLAYQTLPPAERAKEHPIRYRESLTEVEYNQAEASYKNAQETLSNLQNNDGPYDALTRALKPYFRPEGKRNEEQQRAFQQAENEGYDWITEQLRAGRQVNQPDVVRRVAELMTDIRADTDPDRFSVLGVTISGTAPFEGTGADLSRLTDEQKAVLTVPFESIPPHQKKSIEQTLISRGITNVDEEVMEHLAGALQTGDAARYKRIISDLMQVQ